MDFWAEWCGPARLIAPALEEIADEYAGKLTVAKVNIDENPRRRTTMAVRGIPTLILFKDGRPAATQVGALPKSRLKDWVSGAERRRSGVRLPLQPGYPPMEAESVKLIPEGPRWQYEPKWNGFRCLLVADGADVDLRSKSGQPLARYFPDLLAAVSATAAERFVLDGEIIVPVEGVPSFEELQLRLHPAESRVRKLAEAHPACTWRSTC